MTCIIRINFLKNMIYCKIIQHLKNGAIFVVHSALCTLPEPPLPRTQRLRLWGAGHGACALGCWGNPGQKPDQNQTPLLLFPSCSTTHFKGVIYKSLSMPSLFPMNSLYILLL